MYLLNFGATPFNRKGSGQCHVVLKRSEAGLGEGGWRRVSQRREPWPPDWLILLGAVDGEGQVRGLDARI
jgi:hypothetical protein